VSAAVREARVTRLSMAAPDDVSPIASAIAAGRIDPAAIRAVFAKTEGNGCVNDFTRAFAVQSLRLLLVPHLGEERVAGIAMVMSGGTEGALSPHWLVVEALERPGARPAAERLAVGVHVTPPLKAEEIVRLAQVRAVTEGVRAAMADAAIETADAVRFVQVKCPLVTADRAGEAAARGAAVRTADTLKSMGLSRGAAALGVALALEEVPQDAVREETIGSDPSIFSRVASSSAGIELMGNEIVVLGRSCAWTGPLTIDGAVMEDAVDAEAVRDVLARLGLVENGRIPRERRDDLVALLAKAEPSSTGRVRGFRHTMLDDSDIAATRHARGFLAGVLAGLVGHAELFVSGGAEHQGPDGGGPVAAIVRV
jgi:cyanuric acid amidohydrolase